MNPTHAASFNGIGLVYDQYKKPDKALGYFKKASELTPENPVYLQNRGCCLRSLEKYFLLFFTGKGMMRV